MGGGGGDEGEVARVGHHVPVQPQRHILVTPQTQLPSLPSPSSFLLHPSLEPVAVVPEVVLGVLALDVDDGLLAPQQDLVPQHYLVPPLQSGGQCGRRRGGRGGGGKGRCWGCCTPRRGRGRAASRSSCRWVRRRPRCRSGRSPGRGSPAPPCSPAASSWKSPVLSTPASSLEKEGESTRGPSGWRRWPRGSSR